jgi:hypothetical protein
VLSNELATQSIEPVPIVAAILCRAYPAAVVEPISLRLVPVTVTEIAELRASELTAVVLKQIFQGAGGTIVADAPKM